MKAFDFEISKSLCEKEEFLEASKEELRVLIALIEVNGHGDVDRLADLAGVSAARCRSALSLWQEIGAINDRSFAENGVSYEFDRTYSEDSAELTGVEVTEGIRDGNLADLITECARLMGKPMLSALDTKRLTAAYLEYALSAEYIATLAAYIAENEPLTISRLISRIKTITENGVLTLEDLLDYISTSDKDKTEIASVKRALNIFGRNLAPTEKKYVNKWMNDFEYSSKIIEMAYDITLMSLDGKRDFRYMDAILTSWHKAGCKTLEQCEIRNAEEGEKIREQYKSKLAESGGKGKKAKNTPRYGSFDPDEALKMALGRSFPGFDGSEKTEN
jgi:DnaD/phage-associated family protein